MQDIKNYDTFTRVEELKKGWSSDRKFFVENRDGERFLLRLSDISAYEEKKEEFDLLSRFAKTGIKMSQPLDFGTCDQGQSVYQLLTWCDGEEAKEVLARRSEEDQYRYGQLAGDMLRQMAAGEVAPAYWDWATIYSNRVAGYLRDYEACGQRLLGDHHLFALIEEHADCLKGRPMHLIHADFQTDNMVISPTGELYAIDFQGSGLVDPYYALTGVMVSAETSPAFALGQLQSYFGDEVPEAFWRLNSYYLAAEILHAFTVAVGLGQEEIDYSHEMMAKTLVWFDHFETLIPSWYQQ